MTYMKKINKTLRGKKREFMNKRGRMGRSRFFVNLCIVCVLTLAYILALVGLVHALSRMSVPYAVCKNIYYLGVGILFLLTAFGTRALRLKRLRDMGLPVWADLPCLLLLLLNGLGPLFRLSKIPYLQNLDVFNMPGNLRDLLGVFWLIWMLALIIGPSKNRQSIFASAGNPEQTG